jgi:hypothetical protein
VALVLLAAVERVEAFPDGFSDVERYRGYLAEARAV